MCADFYTGLNDALEDHQYPLPIPEDSFARLKGGRCFAKLDLAEAFREVEVDEDSRELLSINPHRRLFKYRLLRFGVKSAPAIFQQVIDTVLTDVPGVAAYLDDITAMGTGPDDLYEKLDRVLNRIREFGFRLLAGNCNVFMQSISYLGFMIDQYGCRPDPANIGAIDRMPHPTNV
ncbi:hypothetical protein P879_11853 [Paragonimus westermani]|uniref:Reverse transcriptase domain-containing protein n=1 Tax=Paragonimus westermani TaxID=34504 RepID=A0A8T0DBP0_9TREM|nr:hypothetical protein P879_11853 [Paragonimus westermani]